MNILHSQWARGESQKQHSSLYHIQEVISYSVGAEPTPPSDTVKTETRLLNTSYLGNMLHSFQ